MAKFEYKKKQVGHKKTTAYVIYRNVTDSYSMSIASVDNEFSAMLIVRELNNKQVEL